jgi:hypothetical protein
MKTHHGFALQVAIVWLTTLLTTAAMAAVPSQMNYQGRLTDPAGNLLNGPHNLTFTLYDHPTNMTPPLPWTEVHASVPLSNGLFSVQLGGAGAPLPAAMFTGGTWYLAVNVNGTGDMAPRLPLNTMPYAFRAAAADSAGTVHYGQVYTVAQSGGDFPTINAALAACAGPLPHLIRVMPGIYAEDLDLRASAGLPTVHLQGAGRNVCTLVGSVIMGNDSLLQGFRVEKGVLCGLTGMPTLLLNTITNDGSGEVIPSGYGVWVAKGSTPLIKENQIVDCLHWGILCEGFGTDAWILGNLIRGNGRNWESLPMDFTGGIRCLESSPHISNNRIVGNYQYGVFVAGEMQPAEPTIDDNVIAYTVATRDEPPEGLGRPFGPLLDGVGIQIGQVIYAPDPFMRQPLAEPRVLANDIHLNNCGIRIEGAAQPSIVGNDINYQFEEGIVCIAQPMTGKQVVIRGNHIHSSNHGGIPNPACMNLGVALDSRPLVDGNSFGDHPLAAGVIDIDYSLNMPGASPILNHNTYQLLNGNGGPGSGSYNADRMGNPIAP